jgi:hypothetical protein
LIQTSKFKFSFRGLKKCVHWLRLNTEFSTLVKNVPTSLIEEPIVNKK